MIWRRSIAMITVSNLFPNGSIRSFGMRTRLESHVRNVHERHYQQMCHICAKVCNSSVSLRDHLKVHCGVVIEHVRTPQTVTSESMERRSKDLRLVELTMRRFFFSTNGKSAVRFCTRNIAKLYIACENGIICISCL